MAAREDKQAFEKAQRRGAVGLDVPVLLARWRSREVRVAKRFREFGGAALAEVEDLYDASVAAIVEKGKTYESEEHLRAVLRKAMRARALRLHRDRQTRAQRLAQAAPSIHRLGEERAWRSDPERALIAHEDDVVVGEFVAELTPLERRVFALCAEGRSWRAIATALRIPETEARSATRACERKRERFVTLYSTGRLCGYRSHTIATVLDGRQSTDLAIRQALAHLRHCRACQHEHHTSESRLRARFDGRVLVLLPVSTVLHGRLWVLEQVQAPLARLAQLLHGPPSPQTAVRERAAEALAGTGVAAKLAAGAVGVAVLAGGAIGIQASVEHPHHRRHARPNLIVTTSPAARPSVAGEPYRRVPNARKTSARRNREPGGFAYLGIPTPTRQERPPAVSQRGGGPFAP